MNALKGKALPWLLNVDIPHQAVYTPDAAELIVRLMLREWADAEQTTPPYQVWNYGGTTFQSIRSFFEQISTLTGKPLRIQVYSRFVISALGLIMPTLREVKEMVYLYENTILLEDRKVLARFPDFRPTPLNDALRETLKWFGKYVG